MRKLVIAIAALVLGWVGPTAADAQKETPPPCVILKRMGPADQVTSHLYSWGIRGKQFQFVEGQLPQGVKFHGRLTDNDVRKILDAGGKVAFVDAHYTDEDLQDARKDCSRVAPSSAGKPPSAGTGVEATTQPGTTSTTTPAPAPAPAPTAAPPQPTAQPPAPASVAAENLATVVIKSTPDGADITVDGKYVGSTPSTMRLAAGDHTILIEKAGFKSWQRTMTVSPGGTATVNATLEKQ